MIILHNKMLLCEVVHPSKKNMCTMKEEIVICERFINWWSAQLVMNSGEWKPDIVCFALSSPEQFSASFLNIVCACACVCCPYSCFPNILTQFFMHFFRLLLEHSMSVYSTSVSFVWNWDYLLFIYSSSNLHCELSFRMCFIIFKLLHVLVNYKLFHNHVTTKCRCCTHIWHLARYSKCTNYCS